MKMKFNRIRNNSFIKNFVTLSIGTVLAQVLIVAVSPILTRLYSPEEIGLFTLFLTIITIFRPVINGRYDISIVNAESIEEANFLAIISLLFSFLLTLIIGIGIFLLDIFNVINFKNLGLWVYFSLPVLLIYSFINILTSYNNRFGDYLIISKSNIVRSFVQAITQVLFGIFKLGFQGLIISYSLSVLFAIRSQLNVIKNNKNIKLVFDNVSLFGIIKKYKNQPIYSAPALLANSLSYTILIFFINDLYSAREVGFYSITFNVLGLPIVLISSNISRVFFERANKEWKINGNFRGLFKKTSIILSIISFFFFTLLFFISEQLFFIVFGEEWVRAGYFAKILIPMFAARFVVSALSLSLVIVNKQKNELLLQIAFLLEALIIYALSNIFKLKIDVFLMLVSLSFMTTYIIIYYKMYRYSKQ